ncbi:MAG: DNA-processing protein DprA [Neisseriaceae bacterium]|nr:DNA-processing protein DprA [Neisseriaceae bacterium]
MLDVTQNKQISTEKAAWLMLAFTAGVGPAAFLKLLQAFGSASAACAANVQELTAVVQPKIALAIHNEEAKPMMLASQAWADGEGCHLIFLSDDDYPLVLAESAAPPPVLFGRGQRPLLQGTLLAMVGSRSASPQGLINAYEFAKDLSLKGYTIVSGLASGIDAAAHEGALLGQGSTIAVVGTGIDKIYPASNKALALKIAATGLVLSEFPLGTGPIAHNFPRRNRVIAGLSRACLVVEASVESGSLITARLAAESGREVFAIPGSIHNSQARGCHRLIKDGAKLVESVVDILEELPETLPFTRSAGLLQQTEAKTEFKASKIVVRPMKIQASSAFVEQRQFSKPASDSPFFDVLQAMGDDIIDIDSLSRRLNDTVENVGVKLLEMELLGEVATAQNGRYQRLI